MRRCTARGGPTLLLAVDYSHRRTGRPPAGSLSAFRAGRAVPPRPDGSCDLTSHVALDAVADAGVRAGGDAGVLLTQHQALRALWPAGTTHPELLDPGGLGGFGWLLQPVGGMPGVQLCAPATGSASAAPAPRP